MLNEENLKDSWKELNRKSVPGVDKQTVKEYEENLEANIRDLKWTAEKKKLSCETGKTDLHSKSKWKNETAGTARNGR